MSSPPPSEARLRVPRGDDTCLNCLFSASSRSFSACNLWMAASSLRGSIKHSALCASIWRGDSHRPQPHGHSTSSAAPSVGRQMTAQSRMCSGSPLRGTSCPHPWLGQQMVTAGQSDAKCADISPRRPTQRQPWLRNWQKPSTFETSRSAKRSRVASVTGARHSGHCAFCGSQLCRQAWQKTWPQAVRTGWEKTFRQMEQLRLGS
mmetsp:Transcript_17877/g.42528  ORF Transcript_17877/g.42528 Transcript_17877/m.42528 type:complete len:205 (+) Transcript_17877:251-865(+)